jgi:hypothetical protein
MNQQEILNEIARLDDLSNQIHDAWFKSMKEARRLDNLKWNCKERIKELQAQLDPAKLESSE